MKLGVRGRLLLKKAAHLRTASSTGRDYEKHVFIFNRTTNLKFYVVHKLLQNAYAFSDTNKKFPLLNFLGKHSVGSRNSVVRRSR